MQCPYFEYIRQEMFDEIEQLNCNSISNSLRSGVDILLILLGKQPADVPIESMMDMCLISGKHITRMYDQAITR